MNDRNQAKVTDFFPVVQRSFAETSKAIKSENEERSSIPRKKFKLESSIMKRNSCQTDFLSSDLDDENIKTEASSLGSIKRKRTARSLGREYIEIVKTNPNVREAMRKNVKTVDELQKRLANYKAARKIKHTNEREENKSVDKLSFLSSPVKLVSPYSKFTEKMDRKMNKMNIQEFKSPSAECKKDILRNLFSSPSKKNSPVKSISSVLCDTTGTKLLNASTGTKESGQDIGRKNCFMESRVSQLLQQVKNDVDLFLPSKYESLYEMFQHTERVVSILILQKKRIRLQEVITNVQQKIKRNFTIHHYAQIVYVYPKSYITNIERAWAPIGGICKSGSEFEYVIEPNLVDENDIIDFTKPKTLTKPGSSFIKNIHLINSPLKKSCCEDSSNSSGKFIEPTLEPWRLIMRAKIFKHLLQQIFKSQYTSFLEKRGILLTEEKRFQRVHPEFDLEIADIPEANLPLPPKADNRLHFTMRDYVRNVDDSFNILSETQKLVNELKSPQKRASLIVGTNILLPKLDTDSDGKKKEMSLIERIRAKEQMKKLQEAMRNPAEERRRSRFTQLERSLLWCICSYFSFRKVSSMGVNELVDQMAYANGTRSLQEMEEIVGLLCEVAPDYFSTTVLNERKYVQLKKNEYAAILTIIRKEISNFKEHSINYQRCNAEIC